MPNLPTIQTQLKGDTGRLAASYLAIIFTLTLVFSSAIYAIGVSQLDRPLPVRVQHQAMSQFDDLTRNSIQDLLQDRADQAKTGMLVSLLLLNLVVLISGAFFSYYLARKTLEPIEATMRAQSRFVTDASHELRTPLTALQLTNEVALRKKKLTLADAKELIGHNLTETIKLRTLSEGLLGLARQESADTSTADVSLQTIVGPVIETLGPISHSRTISVVSTVTPNSIQANEQAVTQIFKVLLDNAVKYSPVGATVTVSSRHDQTAVYLSVHDDGPAIPAKHHDAIFNRFYRIDESRSSRNSEGTGLGLAIATAIADRHGYSVSLKAVAGAGNTFSLKIPNA
ncbi:HAMP domain-containing histidine kinase [Candidatus Saccharibacteria bacterium]|nr:HAMP domain-containing histidine kinase [Candidatus Saccharibacteria bacterium]